VSDVNANIGIQFDTAGALAQLRQLQAGLSKFNQSLTEGNVAAANAQKGLNAQLMQSINATGKFVASQKNIASSTTSFTDSLEKNKLSMSEYFKYTGAAATLNSKTLRNVFAQEKDILNRAMKDRVKSLQTQYVQLTNANGELTKVLQVVPKHLQMVNGKYADYSTRVQMAAQRQQMLNQLIKQGSTQLLNFGKNTQWAGRQLMVGLTIPLTMLGAIASKTFRDMEKATVAFSRVYGDMTTTLSDTDNAIAGIQRLAKEFTKYGLTAVETMEMASKAAAMGLTGAALEAQVISATRLSVLGQVEQQQALETTISLQNAFGIASEDLAKKINYLNAVENQTVLSIEDLTIAIPKAGPVVKQLGGSVEDLAFFMTAMKEGGINASEGANALKSGLASMINPAKKTSEFLANLGINIKGIVDNNAGDLKGTVISLARSLDTLDPLNRARAIEQLFGKFQFSRLSTLFQNVTKDSSQAARALGLAGASVEELAILSERELGKVENAVGVKFQKQIENLKLELIPLGKAFLEAVTPIVQFAGKILAKFNNLSDGTKKFVVGFVAIIGGIAPVLLMTVGLVANGVANLIKFFGMLRGGMAKLNGQNNVLGGGFDYLTQAEIENMTQSQALHASHRELITTFNVEKSSVDLLAASYQNAASQARSLASSAPSLFNRSPGAAGAISGLPKSVPGFSKGGVVPGTGNKDSVISALTPGEVVLTKDTVKNNPEIIAALQNNSVQKYQNGTGGGSADIAARLRSQFVDNGSGSEAFQGRIKTLIDGAMSQTERGVQRVIRYAAESGVKITAEQTDQIDNYRKEMLASIEEAGNALVNETKLTKDELKTALKSMSPISGSQSNTFDLIDKHGGQNASGTFGHVGQTNRVGLASLKSMNVKPEAMAQAGKIDEYFASKGKQTPDFRVANAFGFEGLKQKTNRDMASKGGANPTQLISEMNTLGANKWKTMMGAIGENFDNYKTQLEAFDQKLIANVQQWSAKNPGKNITDGIFEEITNTTVQEITALHPELSGIFTKAKNTITEIRISVGKELDALNAYLKQSGMSGIGTSTGNTKLLNRAGRTAGTNLGTVSRAGSDMGSAVIEGVRSGQGTAAASPSKKGVDAGKEVGDGIAIGLQASENKVKSQSSKLGDAAIPKDNKSKVNTGDKGYFDRLNTPGTMDERQTIKSMDRQRRKIAKQKARVNKAGGINPLATATTQTANVATLASEQAEEEFLLRRKIVNSLKSTVKAASSIRNSSSRTARSSVSVLESQQNIENNTDLTESATKSQTQDTIRASDLTEATTKNLESSLASTKKAAQYDDEIEANKKKLAEQGRQEIAARSTMSQIPMGAQTASGFVNPATAMGYADAYDASGEFTRDKRGSVLFDPETGQPTTMSQKQITQKRTGMRVEKVQKYSGKAAGALGTAAMVAGMAGAPPQATAALGTGAMVAQMAPMITKLMSNPYTAAAVALAAVAGSAYLLNKKLEGTAAAIAAFTRTTTVSTDMLKKIGEQTGKVGANELMNRKRAGGSLNTYIQTGRDGTTEAQKFLSGNAGKELQKAFKSNAAKNGMDIASQDFALQIAAAISDGTIPQDLGGEIAYQMGVNLKDSVIGIKIDGQIRKLIGTDGQNLEDQPLEVRARLASEGASRASSLMSEIQNKKVDSKGIGFMDNPIFTGSYVKMLAGSSSGSDMAAELAVVGSSAIENAQAQADAMSVYYDKQLQTLNNELLATTNKEKQAEIQAKILAMTTEQESGMSRMNNLVAAQLVIQSNIASKLINENVKSGFTANTFIDDSRRREDAFFDAQKSDVKAKYKGTAYESSAQRVLDLGAKADEDKSFASKQEGRTFEAKLNFIMQSGQMNPNQVETMMKIFEGNLKEMDTAINIGLRTHGGAKMAELASMLQGVGKKKAQSIIIQMARKDPKEFDKVGKALAILQRSDGMEVDMTAFINTVGMPGLEKLSKKLDAIEALPDPIEKVIDLQNTGLGKEELDGLAKNWDYYKSLDPAVRKEAIETYTTIFETGTSFKTNAERDAWARIQAEKAAAMVPKEQAASVYTTTLKLLTVGADGKPLDINSPEYKIAVGQLAQTGTEAVHVAKTKLTGKDGGLEDDDKGAKERITTYDELNKRLRNVRLAALDASGGIEELRKALAKTGIKAINDQFRGLEQQLIKTGKAGQFVDYLAGLDQKELNKFGKTATKNGINPITGKKDSKVKKGDFLLNEDGKTMEKGFNKAISGDFNVAQLKSVTLQEQLIKARRKLIVLGFQEKDIQTMLADENYRTLIATGKITDAELRTNAALAARNRITANSESLLTRTQVPIDAAKNAERIPDVVKMLEVAGVNAEAIRTAMSDPDMLNELIIGMDSFGESSQEVRDNFQLALGYLDEMPNSKVVKLVFEQTDAQKQIAGADAAAELFDAYRTIDENTIKSAEGNTYAGLQSLMASVNNQAKIVQNSISLTQSKIDTLQQEVDKDQRDIETNFTRPIEAKQRSMDKLARSAELNFTRPIQALQDRSSVLAQDLNVINNAAEKINEKYDAQQESLSKVAEINQQIIQQQQQQLGLAGALSTGDISAAAKIAQDMRAASASNYAQNSQEALQQARENEINNLRGGVSGKTQKEISEEQYQIGLSVYNLELEKSKVDAEILRIQDEIYALEQSRLIALDAIQVKTDAIALIQNTTLLAQQNQLKALNDQNLAYQTQSDKLFKVIEDLDNTRIVSEKTKNQWIAIKAEATALEKIASGDLARALAVAETASGTIKGDWEATRDAYNEIKSKKVEITKYIREVLLGKNEKFPEDKAETKTTTTGSVAGAGGSTLENYRLNELAAAKRASEASGYRGGSSLYNTLASGGMVKPKYFASGGLSIGTDTVPAMLTPGEFVIKKYAVDSFGVDGLKAINNGTYDGDSVYNYSINVSVKSNADANEIARSVMTQIKSIDNQKLRGTRI